MARRATSMMRPAKLNLTVSKKLLEISAAATMDPHPQLTRAAFGRLRRSLAETASVGRREAPGVGEAEAAGDLTNRGSHHIVVQLVTYLFDPDRMKRRERRVADGHDFHRGARAAGGHAHASGHGNRKPLLRPSQAKNSATRCRFYPNPFACRRFAASLPKYAACRSLRSALSQCGHRSRRDRQLLRGRSNTRRRRARMRATTSHSTSRAGASGTWRAASSWRPGS